MARWPHQLHDACVRVDAGTGFLLERDGARWSIVTAAHVLKDHHTARVTWPSGRVSVNVLVADRDLDLAVLSDHPQLGGLPKLRLASAAPELASHVAFAGFPTGWDELTPVVQRGSVAVSSSDDLWIDGSANPGNSGGPIVTCGDDDPRVVGVVRGRAGTAEESLHKFASVVERLHTEAQEFQGPIMMGDNDLLGNLARITTGGLMDMAKLLDRHFRTGLFGAAGITRIAKVLGE